MYEIQTFIHWRYELATTKIKERFQVTIPREVRDRFKCEVGDTLDVVYQNGRIVMVQQQVIAKPQIAKLDKEEQVFAHTAREKIRKIGSNFLNSVGLSDDEIKVAVKIGLIEPDEAWWYEEEWQAGEREASNDLKEGEVSDAMEGAELNQYLDDLRSNK
jgi:AbrB family looped-hinge helix DNA binding protein